MAWVVERRGRLHIPANRHFVVTRMQKKIADAGRRVTKRIRRNQRKAFGHGGHHRHGGRKWKPLAPTTVERKIKLGVPRPASPLIRFGSMRRRQSVLSTFRLRGRTITWEIRGKNSAAYSHWHQFGLGVVARPPIVFTAQDIDMLKRALIATFPPPRVGRRRGRRGR